MKHFVFLLFVLLTATVCAQSQRLPLRFRADGTFKIVQFTDLHYIHNNPHAQRALIRMREVVEAERPDLVIVTGDMIFGEPADKCMRDVAQCLDSMGVPFCTTFGNHDDESGLSRSELYDIIQATPGCVNPPRGEAVSPDYAVEIASSRGSKTAAVIYCLDSHAYTPIKGVGRYGWFTHDPIGWYRSRSAAYKEANGGTPVPSLAFFHIPLPEYAQAFANPATKVFGNRKEAGGEHGP